ncbi:cellulose synthase subunit BcsC-related outer membrane protein [Limnobacter sp.]|uniref:cellulose synthase subunit BcsC-related outer membrane protein n=1 Tax=Limnobacter sp. TaxID=2003368 RepID=UPI003513FA55
MSKTIPFQLGLLALAIGSALPLFPGASNVAHAAISDRQENIRALQSKGIYWYERFRFDLAAQSFNKILLLDPSNASALRWHGLVDLARGDIQAAQVWLGKLQSVHGPNSPSAIELKQAIALAGSKRQAFAELRYLSNSENVPADLPQRLSNLLDEPPLGDAAVQIYGLMANTPEGAVRARAAVQGLVRQFPDDNRYRLLLSRLGGTTETNPPASLAQAAAIQVSPRRNPVQSRPATPAPATPAPVAVPEPEQGPLVSNFEQGQQLGEAAQKRIEAKDVPGAVDLLEKAVALNPDYPWFRYDLATLLDDQGDANSKARAVEVMQEGLALNNGSEMRFASALLATRQDRGQDALRLIDAVPRAEWSEGMTALSKRVRYGRHLDDLRELSAQGRYNEVATALAAAPTWRAEPEIQELERNLRQRRQARLRMSYENAEIDGDPGVSFIKSTEIPLQLDMPLDFERTLFLRMDTLRTAAGRASPDATNFGKLGTTVATDPAIDPNRLNQNYKGHVAGLGIQTDNWRFDLGSNVGDMPVTDWVGGVQWRTDIGEAGSLRIDLARRMVGGSVLSTAGAIDPLTGQTWGGARRNGLSAVYYTPITPTLDFVGIGRANLITGKNIPDNKEFNLQGILSKTVFQAPGHRVEVGASLFLWSFEKNLRFYTFGQGGYYSPQAFGSLSLPITWTANVNGWSWQLQARVGASESREKQTDLYPLNPELAQAAAAQGNATVDTGGPGGGVSNGFRLSVEKQVIPKLILGGLFEIDRSEGYNPDRGLVYLKYAFGEFFELSVPPEGITPYSRF